MAEEKQAGSFAAPAAKGPGQLSKGASRQGLLPYDVVSWSSYSAQFHPKHIKDNRPFDQSSRWCADNTSAPQFALLKLRKPALLRALEFGKHEKDNHCNVRELKILAGIRPEKLELVLHTGLQNDSRPECIPVHNVVLCQYIMVRPLRVWRQGFNMSIWYIGLRGTDSDYAIRKHRHRVEQEATRLCLKHLRRSGYLDCFDHLLKRSKVQLEDECASALYNLLVQQGDCSAVEEMLAQLDRRQNIFDEYTKSQPYRYEWTPLYPVSAIGLPVGEQEKPSMRGGHQLVVDVPGRVMYLFGGWNGAEELGDLWRYWIDDNRWQLISSDTVADGGPCARSCHRMVLDRDKKLYVLGRFSERRVQQDMRVYDTIRDRWHSLTRNTEADGGPPAVFDHQMAYWEAQHALLVYGGKLHRRCQYGGLYKYDIASRTWECYFKCSSDAQNVVPPRMAHSMFISEAESAVYIFGGQHEGQFRADLYRYRLLDREADLLDPDCTIHSHITASFSQRVVFDADRKEMRFLAGVEQQEGQSARYQYDNVLYICSLDTMKWEQLNFANDESDNVPCRRFGHQFVWDPVSQLHFLSAGNPGLVDSERLRLSDLWSLRLERPSRGSVLKRCIKLIRLHRFNELAARDKMQAYQYLRGPLKEVMGDDQRELAALAPRLFKTAAKQQDEEAVFAARMATFQQLLQFLPKAMREPDADVTDVVHLSNTPATASDDNDDDDGDDDGFCNGNAGERESGTDRRRSDSLSRRSLR